MTENEGRASSRCPAGRGCRGGQRDQRRAEIDAHAERAEQFAHRGPLLRADEEDADDQGRMPTAAISIGASTAAGYASALPAKRRPRLRRGCSQPPGRSSSRRGRRPCRTSPTLSPTLSAIVAGLRGVVLGESRLDLAHEVGARRPPWCKCRRRHAREGPASKRPAPRKSASSS